MHITLQSDVFAIIGLTALISVFTIVMSKKIDRLDPLAKPKGLCLCMILLVKMLKDQVETNVGKKVAQNLGPYIVAIACFIFLSNISGLFAVSSPTANYSVTLTLAALTWVFQQIAQFKSQGVKGYFHAFLEPFFVFLPMNIFGKFSALLSMSLRLFGNILCGSVIMSLVYTFCNYLSTSIVHLFAPGAGFVFNFMGPILAPALHAYFDLFAGFIQTLIFITLTMVFIGKDLPDSIKNEAPADSQPVPVK